MDLSGVGIKDLEYMDQRQQRYGDGDHGPSTGEVKAVAWAVLEIKRLTSALQAERLRGERFEEALTVIARHTVTVGYPTMHDVPTLAAKIATEALAAEKGE
ncbi:hypothetical protein CCP3SC15_2010006 [Gammaproteobacteria bacterium]